MTVRDAMHKGVVSCDSSISVRDAARIMNEKGLRSLVVVDFDCALAGIISETDIVAARLVHEGGKPWDQLTVGEIMTNRVLTVTPDMSLKEAAKIIVDHRIHRVVVAEPDDICNPIGILSLGDIMRYLERIEREEAGEAQATPEPNETSEAAPAAKKTKSTAKKPKTTSKKTVRSKR
ncbi:MAG: CBS domain-containing protein [Anaerolineae bacterium]|nr:CBS domain-containing protein [Candidatus Roseilinea sp.]MDW8450583.1 CBS domain-containing protein [Anaerolineae bacterium]